MKWKEAPHFPERHKLQSKSAWLSGLAWSAMILPDIRYCPPCWASWTDDSVKYHLDKLIVETKTFGPRAPGFLHDVFQPPAGVGKPV